MSNVIIANYGQISANKNSNNITGDGQNVGSISGNLNNTQQIGATLQMGRPVRVDKEYLKEVIQQYFIENPLEELDPNVYEWAKQENKPVYTYGEIVNAPVEMTNDEIEELLETIGGL